MLIEILGSGCPKCFELERRTRLAVRQAGIEATIEHVTDVRAIAERGVLRMPALAVDGAVAVAGAVPSAPELVTLLINRLAATEPPGGTTRPIKNG
jgi:small redox-active disulfide protein 2